MKVTLIASVSANGKVLLANNPNHQDHKRYNNFLHISGYNKAFHTNNQM